MGVAGRLVAAVRARRLAAELRRRRVPSFGPATVGDGAPVVYYLAPDHDRPSGGVRVIYRHVDTLNALGVPAAVVHTAAGFRCTWFDHDTRVLPSAEVPLRGCDVLVVPEWYGPGLGSLPAGPRIVIFNQRAYDTFTHIPLDGTAPGAPYAGVPGLAGLLAVSTDNADYLRYAFPAGPVHVTRNVIDPAVFGPAGGAVPGRARRIAYMPRRRPAELTEVLHLLRARGVLDGWELVPIDGRSERETADLMRGSAIFLSSSEREGFGLPPAEAMAAGCYVVGFTGLAGREFFDPVYCTPVPEGDVLAFARAVEAACEADPQALAAAGRAASATVLDRYSDAGLRTDLLAFYRPLLSPA